MYSVPDFAAKLWSSQKQDKIRNRKQVCVYVYNQSMKHTPLSRTGSDVTQRVTHCTGFCFSQDLPSCAKRKIVLMEGDCILGMFFRAF